MSAPLKSAHRKFIRGLILCLWCLLAVRGDARALDYPVRAVRVVVGFPPGGTNDIVARLMAQYLSDRLGQQFIVENRPGASSNIATEAVVNAPPDGYMLLVVGASNAINATLYDKLNFVFLRDIAPVAGIVRVPLVLEVHPAVPARTVPEFIAYAKANPGKLNMASAGNGNPQHVSGELFKMMAGIDMLHVPYRGEAPALADLLGGQVQVLFGGMPGSLEHFRAGTLRPLAVTTAARSPVMPELPSVGEFLAGYDTSVWYGIGAPKGTPAEIVDKLNREINAGLADAKMKARFAELSAVAIGGSPAEFGAFVADETQKWGRVVKFSGAKPD
jgi:tripartite-type tricarboxylate transporter receptor subunit TctC